MILLAFQHDTPQQALPASGCKSTSPHCAIVWQGRFVAVHAEFRSCRLRAGLRVGSAGVGLALLFSTRFLPAAIAALLMDT